MSYCRKMKCIVRGKGIENEEMSILFCSDDCRRRYRPDERGIHRGEMMTREPEMMEIHNYDIKTGETDICYNGQQFGSAVGMCEIFNRNIEGFYYWTVKVFKTDENDE